MKALNVIGQIIGYCLIVYNMFIFATKNRKNILTRKLICDIATCVENLCFGTYTGAALLCVSIGRDVVFLNREKRKWAQHRVWLFVFLVGMCISPILTWKNWTSLLPLAGSLILSLGLYCSNSKQMRVLGPIGHALWATYCALNGNVPQAIGDTLTASIGMVTLIKDIFVERKAIPAVQTVAEETANTDATEEEKSDCE